MECSEGAAVGSVASADVARQRVVCSEGAAVGSGGRGEAARVECSEGAAVGSVASVDVPSDTEEGCCSMWMLRQRFSG